MPDYGVIQVRTFRASEALPIKNASVKITGSDEHNTDIQISELTNSDGITPEIRLPAPSASLSMFPNAASQPYSNFDVEIVKEGYYPKKILNIPIFAGIKAVLPIEMIPLVYSENGDIKPLNNLNSVIYENDKL
jgi:hypothetical protein